ncbi:hypothetical protein P3342_001573 [Pyrenophora teres f. teres]|nr:hypothetical protein P3342_001573 [Pyrenophora teres f. teres]
MVTLFTRAAVAAEASNHRHIGTIGAVGIVANNHLHDGGVHPPTPALCSSGSDPDLADSEHNADSIYHSHPFTRAATAAEASNHLHVGTTISALYSSGSGSNLNDTEHNADGVYLGHLFTRAAAAVSGIIANKHPHDDGGHPPTPALYSSGSGSNLNDTEHNADDVYHSHPFTRTAAAVSGIVANKHPHDDGGHPPTPALYSSGSSSNLNDTEHNTDGVHHDHPSTRAAAASAEASDHLYVSTAGVL